VLDLSWEDYSIFWGATFYLPWNQFAYTFASGSATRQLSGFFSAAFTVSSYQIYWPIRKPFFLFFADGRASFILFAFIFTDPFACILMVMLWCITIRAYYIITETFCWKSQMTNRSCLYSFVFCCISCKTKALCASNPLPTIKEWFLWCLVAVNGFGSGDHNRAIIMTK